MNCSKRCWVLVCMCALLLACDYRDSPKHVICGDVPEYLEDDITGFTISSLIATSTIEITNIEEAIFGIEAESSNAAALNAAAFYGFSKGSLRQKGV